MASIIQLHPQEDLDEWASSSFQADICRSSSVNFEGNKEIWFWVHEDFFHFVKGYFLKKEIAQWANEGRGKPERQNEANQVIKVETMKWKQQWNEMRVNEAERVKT